MSGYSGTPLWKKLGYKPGMKAYLVDEPQNYPELNTDETFDFFSLNFVSLAAADVTHIFVTTKAELNLQILDLKKQMQKSAAAWISWPKGKSKIPTDLNENIIREAALTNGLVDVKVCAVDEDWSGLKLVYRLKDR